MAITTYAELQAAIANWIVRGDMTARIPEFIALGEARMMTDLRLRPSELNVSLTAVPSSNAIPLPAAYSEALACWLTLPSGIEPEPLRAADPATILAGTVPARPYVWAIDGTKLVFERPCDQAYAITLRILETFALSTDAPTNDCLTRYPNVYLGAAMAEAAVFLRDPDLIGVWEGKYKQAMDAANTKDARSRAQAKLVTEPGVLSRFLRGNRSGFNINTGY